MKNYLMILAVTGIVGVSLAGDTLRTPTITMSNISTTSVTTAKSSGFIEAIEIAQGYASTTRIDVAYSGSGETILSVTNANDKVWRPRFPSFIPYGTYGEIAASNAVQKFYIFEETLKVTVQEINNITNTYSLRILLSDK